MQDKDKKELLSALSLVTTTGISLIVNIGVGLVGGRFADGWLGTAPWGMLAGVLVGVVAGFWSVYKRITGNK